MTTPAAPDPQIALHSTGATTKRDHLALRVLRNPVAAVAAGFLVLLTLVAILAQFCGLLSHGLRRGALSEDAASDVAASYVEERERDDRDPEKEEDAADKAPRDVVQHDLLLCRSARGDAPGRPVLSWTGRCPTGWGRRCPG